MPGDRKRYRRSQLNQLAFACVATALTVGSLSGCSGNKNLRSLESAPLHREPAQGSAPVHTELQRVHVRLADDGTYQRTDYHRYRIVDQSGVVNWGHVSAYYSPWFMDPPKIEARVVNGANKTALDPNVLTLQPAYPSAPDLYGDARVIRGPLPAVRVGSVIEEEIVTKTHKAFLAPNSFHSVAFQSAIPKDRVELVVDAPVDMDVRFEVREARVQKTMEESEGRRVISYVGEAMPALEPPEPLVPGDQPYWPSVAFSAGLDWPALAAIYAEVVEKQISGVDFATIANEVVAASDSDENKIRKLHAWVKSRVRYIGVEFGESSVIPYTPDETVSRGFGDCKDQASLLVGLLRAAGLDAHVALLRAGTGEDVIASLPSLDVFNHAIVKVDGERPRWLDPTADLMQADSLPVADRGRLALVAAKNTKTLERIPHSSSTDNTFSEERTVILKDQGNPDVFEKSSATGVLDSELRGGFAHAATEVEEGLKEYVEAVYETEKLGVFEHGDPVSILEPFSVQLEAKESPIGHSSVLTAETYLSERTVFNWVPSPLTAIEDDERKSPLALPLPYQVTLRWRVRPPRHFVLRQAPESLQREFGPALLQRRVAEQKDGSLLMQTRFDLRTRVLKPEQVQKFRHDFESWQESRIPRAVFEHRSRKLVREGDISGAVELLWSEAQSGSGWQRLRLAETLRPFLFERAQREARQAGRQDWEDAQTQLEAGHLLSRNSLGEDLGKGFDRSGALVAYERAALLDDDDIYAKLRRAVVLETSADGNRYFAPESDLKKALEIYASISDKKLRDFDGGSFQNNPIVLRYWAGKHEALRQVLLGMPLEEVPATLAVMNEAARVGTLEAVTKEADRLNLVDESRASALQSASRRFASDRKYSLATQALQLAMRATKNPDQFNSRLAMLRKSKKTSIEEFDSKTPVGLATDILVYVMSAKDVDAKLLARHIASGAGGKDSALLQDLDELHVPRDPELLEETVLGDMLYGSMSARIEGSDRVGHRVELTQQIGSNLKLVAYVVKEGDRYKLRSLGASSAEMGVEALSSLRAGNDDKARQWLDWARQEIGRLDTQKPVYDDAFPLLWAASDGRKIGDVEPEVAAAALASTAEDPRQALAVLKASLSKSTNRKLEHVLLDAIYWAHSRLDQHEAALNVAQRLHRELPDSTIAYWMVMDSLWELRRYEEFEEAIRTRLALGVESERIELTRELIEVLVARGELAQARQLRQKLIDRHEADGGDFNDQAWQGLFLGLPDDSLEHALRAVELKRSVNALHTLATVYAELGRLDDAARTLTELLKARPDYEPASVDRYVFGLIAEQLGFVKEAKQHYRSVDQPEEPRPTSTHRLARKRLQGL